MHWLVYVGLGAFVLFVVGMVLFPVIHDVTLPWRIRRARKRDAEMRAKSVKAYLTNRAFEDEYFGDGMRR